MSCNLGTAVFRRVTLAAISILCAAAVAGTVWAYQTKTSTDKSAEQSALAVNDYEVDGVEVALLSVKRISDGTITVKWQYRNKTDQPKRLGESFEGMGSSEAFSLVWHAYLVDARNKTKYPVVKDQRGEPVAGKHGPRKVVVLGPKQTMNTWAKFIAVPPEVKKISVFIPGTQPFEDVAIEE
jgi:hypothetical protein